MADIGCGNMDVEAEEADIMTDVMDVVVVADSSSGDEKKHLKSDSPSVKENIGKANGASRKRGSSAVLDDDDSEDRSKGRKDTKSEAHARSLRTRTSKVSYAEKEDDDLVSNRRKTPSKKKAGKEKSTEDKVDGVKEEAPKDTGDTVDGEANGGRSSRKALRRTSLTDAETKEQKRLAAEAAVRAKEVPHFFACITTY